MRMINTTLGEIADIITGPFGSQLHMRDYVDEGIAVIMPQNIGDRIVLEDKIARISESDYKRLKKYQTQNEDIVYSRRGDVEKHAFIRGDKPYLCGTGCLRVRVNKEKVYPRYLSLFLSRPETKRWLSQHAIGSNMMNLNKSILGNVPVFFPNMNIQIEIAELLQAIDDKIQLNIKMIKELEEMAKMIYGYWFLQFEFPNKDGKPYKSFGGKMVWNKKLQKMLPFNWKELSIDEIGTLKNGINYKKKVMGDKEYKIVNVRNMSDSSLLLDKSALDTISLISSEADKYLLLNNSILIARSGIPGAIRILNDIEDTIYCGFIICLSLKSLENRNYLVYSLKNHENTFTSSSGGTILKNVSQDILKKIYIPMPPQDILKKFNQKIDSIFETIDYNLKENEKLRDFRDYLLPLLMNGQVGFKGLESEING